MIADMHHGFIDRRVLMDLMKDIAEFLIEAKLCHMSFR